MICFKNGFFAGAQLKSFLQHFDGGSRRTRTWVRSEKFRPFIDAATVIGKTREVARANADVRVARVVAQTDVVVRLKRLDEIVLKQERFGFGTRNGGFNPRNAAHHQRYARGESGFAKV